MAHNWIRMTPDSLIPQLSVLGEPGTDGFPIYVGRAIYNGNIFPARVDSKNHCAYISWGGSQIKQFEYEILVGDNYRFVKYHDDGIPLSAVRAGNTADGEPLYVGRGIVKGKPIVGKIHPIHQCLFVPFGGEEHQLDSYEFLVRETPPSSTSVSSVLDKDQENLVSLASAYKGMSASPSQLKGPARARGLVVLKPKPKEPHTWESLNWTETRKKAIIAGVDSDKCPIYVGRALHDGQILPAKLVPNKGVWVSQNGTDYGKWQYEALVGKGYSWVVGVHSGNNIPLGAVSTGKTKDGKNVYVGRGIHLDSLTPGKVHPGTYGVYIPYFYKEHKISNYYEILVQNFNTNVPNAVIDNTVNSSSWVSSKFDKFHTNAVVAGIDIDNCYIYVGRAKHNGEKLPAKVIYSRNEVSVSFDHLEIFKDEFELLVGDGYSWEAGANSGDNIPPGAVSTGKTQDGKEEVYVGRAFYEGSLIPGKIYRGTYGVYIPFSKKEVKVTDFYEILVKAN